jgi:mono/diheme cytochrome c family protein
MLFWLYEGIDRASLLATAQTLIDKGETIVASRVLIRVLVMLSCVLLINIWFVGCAPAATPVPPAEELVTEAELMTVGQDVYGRQCEVCHRADGRGEPNLYPALAGNDFVVAEDPTPVIDITLRGRGAMPAFNRLSNRDLAGVISYIRNTWNNSASMVMPAEIEAVR